jgi:hypothetical protein
MTRRAMVLLGLASMVALAAGGVSAGLAWANARADTRAADCCPDPICPPGCCEACPPDGTSPASAATKAAAETSSCCDDPACPPDCCPECPPDCLGATAKACCPNCP